MFSSMLNFNHGQLGREHQHMFSSMLNFNHGHSRSGWKIGPSAEIVHKIRALKKYSTHVSP